MSKRNEKKKRRQKREAERRTGRVKVDEHFQYEHLEIIRAGKQVIMRNNASPEQHSEMLKRAARANKQVVNDLAAKIKELQGMISKYDPLDLMYMAGCIALGLLAKGKTESELKTEENKVLPSIEYLQYLIARTSGDPKAAPPSDEESKALWEMVGDVIDLTSAYLQTRTPKGKDNPEIEDLVHTLDLKRLIVRVNRFPNFQEDYWRISFEPFNVLLKEAYGVNASEIIAGLKQLSEYQSRGIIEKHFKAVVAMKLFEEKAHESGLKVGDSLKEVLANSPELKALHEDAQQKIQEAFTVKTFEITDVSKLPKAILALLSVSSGEKPLNTLTGPNNEDLSPLSTDILHYKPFFEAGGKFYTFYHSGFEDRMAQIIEDDLNKRFNARKKKIEKDRSDYIEKEAIDLLGKIVGSSFVAQNLHYPNPDQDGFTELDGMIEVDDVLFLIEVKAGAISVAASRGAPSSLEKDFKELIFDGQRQSERAERYIRSYDEVAFYKDDKGKEVAKKLTGSKYRKIFRIVVTREQLGWVGADLARLSVVDPTLSKNMPWQVSLDDLWAIADLFRGKGVEFCHYLEVRLAAALSRGLHQYDEIDHIALYNDMNYYHKNVGEDADRMVFHSFGLGIDKYFMAKAAGENAARPSQKTSKALTELIESLNSSGLSHSYEVGSFLLSGDLHQRKDMEKHIKKLRDNTAKGHRTVRMVAKELKTGFSIGQIVKGDWHNEEYRCALFMSKQGLERWVSVQLDTQNGFTVSQIKELRIGDYTQEQLQLAEVKLAKDMQANILNNKIASNQICPCGSGERFKNCHGKRHG
jgi:hypothetical protein